MRIWLIFSCVIGFLSVAGGAFGAHALEATITPERLDTFDTGTQYAQMHAVALLGVSILGARRSSRLLTVTAASFTLGALLFTGSLWTLAVTGVTWLGAVTPLGGLAFLTGWTSLLIYGWRSR
ncbi:MAG: DUF423 domain-containing protein [Myxococcota bacterium]